MGVTHLADSSVLISRPQAAPPGVGEVATSVVCVGELRAGTLLASSPRARAERRAVLEVVLRRFAAIMVDDAVAVAYADLRAGSRRGPSNDLWIAATARAHRLVLLTRDERLAALDGVETLLLR